MEALRSQRNTENNKYVLSALSAFRSGFNRAFRKHWVMSLRKEFFYEIGADLF